MTYDGVLVMPSDYVIVKQEEMTYVDGGYYMNHDDCNALRFAIGVTIASNYAYIAAAVSAYAVGGAAVFTASVPGLGLAVGGYLAVVIVRSAEQIASALVTEAFYRKGIDWSLGFSWFTPYIKGSARTK